MGLHTYAKHHRRTTYMIYVTIADLSDMIRKNLWKIPHDIDLVVGIPRSGLMAANMVALYLNKRLSDIDSFIDGRVFSCGNNRSHMVNKSDIKKILVVDDSVHSGSAMSLAKEKLSILTSLYDFSFFAPIVTSHGARYVDEHAIVIDDNRIFEWNLFHHPQINCSCLDMDGVLCRDPVIDDDGEMYCNFINTAEPIFLPTTKIDTIITCRLEKYRTITEEWLQKHGIQYNHLIMLDFPDKKSRLAWGKHGEYKANYYSNSIDSLFIESSLSQAEIIANISGKPVICIETNELIEKQVTPSQDKKVCGLLKKQFPKTYNYIRNKMKSL